MPTEKNTNGNKVDFFSFRNPAPAVVSDSGPKEVPVYGWDFKDYKTIIVKKGVRCPAADVQAAKCETLTEMLQRMDGKTPLQKIANAVSHGIVPVAVPNGAHTDETKLPKDVLTAHQMIEKGKAAAAALPSELTGGESKLDKILDLLTEDNIKAYLAKKYPAKPAEGEKHE